jgi:predicted transglutaminase-like cysteine proteinase
MLSRAKTIIRIVAIGATLVAGLGPAQAQTLLVANFEDPAFARTIGPTSIPIGHADFCKRHRGECTSTGANEGVVALTEARWLELVDTNNRHNGEIVPVTDDDLYKVGEFWAYPDGYGDCEDYALAKRRDLISKGWNAAALLLTVVREQNGNGHAVLMVRTDRGDLVLDNQDSMVRVWSDTPYQFVKRQSQTNAGQWVLIDDSRQIVTTVASTNQ